MDTTKVYEEKVYKKAQNQARQDVVCFFSPFASGIQTDVYAYRIVDKVHVHGLHLSSGRAV